MESKKCNKCSEIKPLGEFYKHPESKDGHMGLCKACHKARAKKVAQANPERTTEYKKRWKQNNPEKSKEAALDWYYRNRESQLEYKKQYDAAHAEERREKGLVYRIENQESIRSRGRRNYHNNQERYQENGRAWRQNNPEKDSIKQQRTRNRRKQLGDLPEGIREILFDAQGNKCLYCQRALSEESQIDHILPTYLVDLLGKSHPGNAPENLCLACPACNTSKGRSLLEDWLKYKYPLQMDEILLRVDRHSKYMATYKKRATPKAA